jgi:deazaflavin-dependent oxidoreductase (nitroreductase family)
MVDEEDLAKVAHDRLMYLTTIGRKTGNPHLVEVWFAVREGQIFLSHEGEETDWMKNIRRNSQVSFEIGGKNFTGKAHFLEDSTDEAWIGKEALYEKYYSKATREVIEDWFSLSKILVIEL